MLPTMDRQGTMIGSMHLVQSAKHAEPDSKAEHTGGVVGKHRCKVEKLCQHQSSPPGHMSHPLLC